MISPFSGSMFTPKRIEILGVGFSPNGPANSNSAPLRPPDWGNDCLDPSWILIIYYRLSWKLTKGTPSNVPPQKAHLNGGGFCQFEMLLNHPKKHVANVDL